MTTTTVKTSRWGGYARISDDPDDTQRGVGRQREDIGVTVDRHDANPDDIRWYVENDTSAYKKRRVPRVDPLGNRYDAYRVIRPVWHQALADLRAGVITGLVVYDLDRLARDPRDLEDAIEVVQHYGATIVSAGPSTIDLTTDAGIMAARIQVTMANKSSADTARRVARAHLENARKGVAVGGVRPFGFEADKVTHRPDEAAMIRQAAADVIAGVPLRRIADDWQASGVTSPRNRPWRGSTIRQMLKGPRLAGWRVHQGKIATDADGNPVRGQWEPILDQDTFDRVQTVLARPEGRRRVPRKGARHYLLTGIIRCGKCNSLMYGNGYGGDNGRHYYVCQGSTGDKHIVSISGHGTDDAITQLVLARLASEDIEAPAASYDGDARLAEVKTKITSLMAAFTDGRLSEQVVFPQVERLEAERDRLTADREAFIAATAGPRVDRITPAEWEAMDTDRRRAVVERLLSAVLILPAKQRQNRLDLDRIKPVWRP